MCDPIAGRPPWNSPPKMPEHQLPKAAFPPRQPTAAVQHVTASGVPSPPPKPVPSASPEAAISSRVHHSPNFASCLRTNCNFLGPSPFSTYPRCLAGNCLMPMSIFGGCSLLLLFISEEKSEFKAPNYGDESRCKHTQRPPSPSPCLQDKETGSTLAPQEEKWQQMGTAPSPSQCSQCSPPAGCKLSTRRTFCCRCLSARCLSQLRLFAPRRDFMILPPYMAKLFFF